MNSIFVICISAFTLANMAAIEANMYFQETITNNNTGNNTDRNYHSSMLCKDVMPQRSINLEQIMGMWYGIEIIIHNQDVPGIYKYNSCVELRLSDVTDQISTYPRDYIYMQHNYRRAYQQQQQQQQQQQMHADANDDGMQTETATTTTQTKFLSLIWKENNDKNVEYILSYNDRMPGLWTNIGDQRGSMVVPNQYTQFTGTVQVVKAVNDHLVLTFCGDNLKSAIYTIVLSRQNLGLSNEALRSIRSLLSKRGLATETIRQVCASAAAPATAVANALLITMLFAIMKQCL